MTDTAKIILEKLQADWNKNYDGLVVGEISFVHGGSLSPSLRFATHSVVVEVKNVAEPIVKRSLARNIHYKLVQVDVWIKILPPTDEAKRDKMELMDGMKSNIERIVKENQVSLSGIRFARPRSWTPMNELLENEIVLREHMEVTCIFEVV